MAADIEEVLLDGQPLIRRYHPLLSPEYADDLLRNLRTKLPWEQPCVRLYGREYPVPRLQSWHGDAEACYRYSGLNMRPEAWTEELASLRAHIEAITGHVFNSVLVNLYRHGRDRMGWHADDEPELGADPWVASLSLGAVRDFALRRKGENRQALKLALRHNELILMAPALQRHWQHGLPARARIQHPRINLTFRRVRPSAP